MASHYRKRKKKLGSRGTAKKFTRPQWKRGVRRGRTRAKRQREEEREIRRGESPRRETCFHSSSPSLPPYNFAAASQWVRPSVELLHRGSAAKKPRPAPAKKPLSPPADGHAFIIHCAAWIKNMIQNQASPLPLCWRWMRKGPPTQIKS